jgi:Predicted Rossmann fold nucleotide-binding protein
VIKSFRKCQANQSFFLASSCGSTAGSNPVHLEAARALASEFHKNNVQLVYGGGNTGLMGEIAKTLVSLSGPKAVHGVIPRAMVQAAARNSAGEDETASATPGGKVAERVVSESLDGNEILESTFGRYDDCARYAYAEAA